MLRDVSVIPIALGALLTLACGSSTPAVAVRPPDITAGEAVGETCEAVADYGQPLVVDWKAHHRASLEASMSDGVAVVAYDCKSLRVLPDCHAEGSYGTLAVSRKEEVVELENADEIRANLPTFGGKLAADFSAEMTRGAAINLAMIMVGKKRTTVRGVARSGLVGSCAGATHYVRGAFMGAFAVGTSTRGNVQAAAAVFGAGASALSNSVRKVMSRDGDPSACTGVEPGASTLPGGCGAMLRLELTPIVEDGSTAPILDSLSASTQACPAGMVLAEGKCTKKAAGVSHVCDGTLGDCLTQCDKGNARSCAVSGEMFRRGQGLTVPNYPEALARFEKACNAGETLGCVGLGILYLRAEAVPKDTERARTLFEKSCEAGEPTACAYLAEMYKDGEGVGVHYPKALEYGRRACEAGEAYGCYLVAMAYFREEIRDFSKSVQYLRKACFSDEPTSCVLLGNWNKRGDSMPKNFVEAKALYERACESRVVPGFEEDDVAADGCYEAAQLYHYGQGIPQDGPRATRLYKKACDRKHQLACSSLKKITTEPLPKPGELRYVPLDEVEDP